MASSFDALPPEIVQKCVEFLDFDLVSGDLKGVSKATRGVARRALTRGRWKPFRYVAEQGLAAVSEIDQRAFFLGQELEHAEHGPLVGRGLGAWSDPLLAARFTRKFHVRYGYSRSYATEAEMYFHGARAWSDDWVDRTKASAFVVEMARIYDASPYHYH